VKFGGVTPPRVELDRVPPLGPLGGVKFGGVGGFWSTRQSVTIPTSSCSCARQYTVTAR
jgi:hypothetical protein